jgi:hypothetical protein
MGLQDPVIAYNAATNVEAQLIKLLLASAGIEAAATEDLSLAGVWMFGVLPEIHKPQVWVSSHDQARAQQILEDYERELAERTQASEDQPGAETIEVVCEDCHRASTFPSSQRGTVQDCPHCGAYVDVGGADDSEPFWSESDPEHP